MTELTPVEARRIEVGRRFKAGDKVTDIMRDMRLSRDMVYRDLRAVPGLRETKTDDEVIARQYLFGVPVKTIAESMGLHTKTVHEALGRKGVSLKKSHQFSQKDLASSEKDIIRRYLAGESGEEIAETFNTSRFIVYLILKNHDTPLRPHGRTPEEMKLVQAAKSPAKIKMPSQVDHTMHTARLAHARIREANALNKPNNEAMIKISQTLKSHGYKARFKGAIDIYNASFVVEHVAIEALNSKFGTAIYKSKLKGTRLRTMMKDGYTVVYLRVSDLRLEELETKAMPALFTLIEQTKTDTEPSFYVLHYDGSILRKGTANEGSVDKVSILKKDYQ